MMGVRGDRGWHATEGVRVPDEIRERMRDEIQDAIAGCASGYYQQIHPPEAADAVLAVLDRGALMAMLGAERLASSGWCPIHGEALCPEQYMVTIDGSVAPGYMGNWNETMRCGKRVPVYRIPSEDPQ